MHLLAAACAVWGAASGCGLPGEDLFAYHVRDDAGAQGGAGQGGSASTSSDSVTVTASSQSASASSSSSSSGGPVSSSSGTLCPNGVCDPGETNATCPQDCDAECGHGPCETGAALSPGCSQCAADVCAQDAYCCDNEWDGQCVEQANRLCGGMCCGDGECSGETCRSCPADCGTCPTQPTCPHTVCFTGEPLDGADCHDTCVADVCAQDSSCCAGTGQSWDGECQSLSTTLCGGPDPCIVSVCAQMPSCCDGPQGGAGGGGGAGGAGAGGSSTPPAWTSACVDLAKTLCNTTCNCPHSVCGTGSALSAGCNPCAAAICEADPVCCTQQWDGFCTEEAKSICGIDCM